jgi:hypothetical protein
MTILVSAKKMGLSMMELRELRMQDLMDYIDIWTDNVEKQATQEDIDAFYSM